MALFVVYELDTESGPPGGSAATELEPAFVSEPLGCYFADDPKVACVMAAERLGKPGVFAALKADSFKLGLGVAPSEFSEDDAKKLKKKQAEAREKAAKG